MGTRGHVQDDPDSEAEDARLDSGDLEECGAGDHFNREACPGGELERCVFHVDQGIVQPGNGADWKTALQSVQQGIDRAYCSILQGMSGCEVWVKKGVHRVHLGCRWDTLRLRPGVRVYGGFEGEETDIENRDWRENETVISGDSPTFGSVNTVVFGADGALLDGFVIEGGLFERQPPGAAACGGGLFVNDATMSVENCTFRHNESSERGGGVCITNSNVEFKGCRFFENRADHGGGLFAQNSLIDMSDSVFDTNMAVLSGAGISTIFSTIVRIRNGVFLRNTSLGKGGGIAVEGGELHIEDSEFAWNTSHRSGGGVGQNGGGLEVRDTLFQNNECLRGEGGGVFAGGMSELSVINGVFWKNAAAESGGAIMNREGKPLVIASSTFVANQSVSGVGAVSLDYLDGTSQINNCILWDNTTPSISEKGGTLFTTGYNYIEDLPDGGLDGGLEPPGFHDMDAGDFRLLPGSPCIDRANDKTAPSLDFLGRPRVDDPDTPNRGAGIRSYVDIGAYEYQAFPR